MSRGRRWLMGVVLALLVLLLGFLFNRTTAFDFETQNRVGLTLRELEKLDAAWTMNILRAHIGAGADDARLVAPPVKLGALQQSLREALPLANSPDASQAWQRMADAFQAKLRLVEQFKPVNAALREVLVALPPAITDLRAELNGIEGAIAPRRSVLGLDAALGRLLTDSLRFNLAPRPAVAARIDATVGQLLALRDGFSPAARASIDEVAGQARALLRLRPLESELEARIEDTRSAAAIDQLSVLFDRAFDAELIQKQRFRSWLFAYAGLLLILLMLAARRLRRSYAIIGKVNHDLQAANETLEARVAERTAELEAQSERLRQLAHHDSLTGLINFRQLTRLLEHALVRAGRRGTTVAVMFIDLDGFKAVNDTHGHGTGDLVLQAVARRVQSRLRREDTLARLGGDEFVILLEEVLSREGAMRVAQLALDEIAAITEAGGNPVRISASIGISSAHGREGTARGAAALLAEADQAMYQARQAGKAAFSFSPQEQWAPQPAAARH
ncbi:MAG: diguanylate cyclase [Massilia sp.]